MLVSDEGLKFREGAFLKSKIELEESEVNGASLMGLTEPR